MERKGRGFGSESILIKIFGDLESIEKEEGGLHVICTAWWN
jgi:hypothetical protein